MRAGVTDDSRAQAPCITGRNTPCEKHPGVCALTGARNLQRGGHAEFVTGLHECTGIVPPFRLVEVDREEIAAVVFQQRIHPDRVLTGQVVVDHRIGQRNQQTIAAVPALDTRLLADTSAPFVGTRGHVAGLAGGLAFPANGKDIGAPTKQPTKQRHLLGGGKLGRLRLTRHQDDRLRRTPLDTVRFEQCDQAGVFGLQRCQLTAMRWNSCSMIAPTPLLDWARLCRMRRPVQH